MSAYKIEKNIPIVDSRCKGNWPFKDMEVGDSFFVGDRTQNYLSAIARSYGLRHEMKFSVRKDGEGFRVFRIA